MIWALIFIPLVGGVLSFFLGSDRPRRALMVICATVHFALVLRVWGENQPLTAADGWLAVDAAGLLFLSLCSALFLAAAVYALGYLGPSQKVPIHDYLEGFQFGNRPEGIFVGCLLLFLAAMTTVTLAQHLGILWVAVEATTLASAPLIYYHRHHRSLEAAWKYLLICSVGIALALLGNFFLAVAAAGESDHELSLLLPELIRNAAVLTPTWLKAAFLLILVGYGTKMGLAPLHSWLPEAHSESPSLVSALLSGALLNCAFLAVLRLQSVLTAAGLGAYGQRILLIFGLLSMGWAALLLITQTDYKRLLAYSSVEHMGVLAFGVGIGGLAGAGAMLHAVNHSLAKGALFLVAGNILAAYRSKSHTDVHGLLRTLPMTGVLWLAGILAIVGLPPFGLFTSELVILKGALAAGRWGVATGYLAALAVAFGAIAWAALRMVYGAPAALPAKPEESRAGSVFLWIAPAGLALGVLVLGVWVPRPLWQLIQDAAAILGGGV
jgi:hydrogenase-4 component F